jgi:hypothetical protein
VNYFIQATIASTILFLVSFGDTAMVETQRIDRQYSTTREVITDKGISLTWPMATMAVSGIAYIVAAQIQARNNSKNITALWTQVNKWKN